MTQLTGQRFLAGYSSEETQYKALMDAGTTFAQQYQLRPGIALSAQQMAQLTSDIVWLVKQTVTLADGSTTQALVPQVYARVREGDLDGTGTLLAGQVTNLNLAGDITNTGTVAGRTIVDLTAENVNNLGGRISGNDTRVTARNDLNNIGGTIDGANSLTAIAGRDLNVASTTSSASNQTSGTSSNSFSLTGIDRVAGLYVTSENGGTLIASAGRDANLIAGIIANNGTNSDTTIMAGRDLNLGTVGIGSSSSLVRGAGTDFLDDRQAADVGSQVNAQGNLTLGAGRDLNAKAASVQAAGDLTALAGNNINITNGQQTNSSSFGLTSSESDLFSSSSTTERRSGEQSNAVGSSIGGKTITSVAGNDQTVTGSSVISDTGTRLAAGNNLTIQAGTNTSSSTDFKETKESGLMGSGGFGITIGSQEQSLDQKTQGTTAAASTVGSIGGDITLQAGNAYKQVGSDVQAPQGNIDITAKKVDIVEARETSQSQSEQKFSQSGLSVGVTSPIISALQTMDRVADAAGQTKDGRMQALAGATAGLTAKNAYDAIKADPASAGGINISITVGSSESQSNTSSSSDTARGSTVATGGNLSISATGAGKDSDILVRGSTLKAGNNASLKADDDITLIAAANTAEQSRSSSSSSGGVGLGISVGRGGAGFGFTANASASKGEGNGQDTVWTNTRVEAGNQLTLESGADTTLKGAVAKAETIKADVGGNLNIESLQDTSSFHSKDQSLGGSVTMGAGFSGTLPDGSTTQALVPQVYARVRAGDLDGTGTLLAGRELNINLSGDLTNTGTLAGRTVMALTAENIHNLGGRISGDDVTVAANNDLNNIGGTIDGANSLTAIAGRDLNVASTTSSASNQTSGTSSNNFSLTGIDRVAGLYVTGENGGTLVASAGRDVNLIAGIIANNGATSDTTVIAGRDLNLGTVETSSSSSIVRGVGTDCMR